jgi:hypothetical protein
MEAPKRTRCGIRQALHQLPWPVAFQRRGARCAGLHLVQDFAGEQHESQGLSAPCIYATPCLNTQMHPESTAAPSVGNSAGVAALVQALFQQVRARLRLRLMPDSDRQLAAVQLSHSMAVYCAMTYCIHTQTHERTATPLHLAAAHRCGCGYRRRHHCCQHHHHHLAS